MASVGRADSGPRVRARGLVFLVESLAGGSASAEVAPHSPVEVPVDEPLERCGKDDQARNGEVSGEAIRVHMCVRMLLIVLGL